MATCKTQADYKHQLGLNILTRFSFFSLYNLYNLYNLIDRMIKKHTPATEPMTTPQIPPVDKDESIKDNKMIEAMKTVDKVKLKQAK